MRHCSAAAVCAGLALALGGCGDDGADAGPEQEADPAVERLTAACTEYREAAYAELPPAAPAGYPAYVRERRQLVDRLIATLREERESERRARLIAAASQLLTLVDDMRVTSDPGSFAGAMYTRASILEEYERSLDAAAEKAGVECGLPAEPSAELREFRERAGEVCETAGSPAGLPARDADMIRERVDGHAEIEVPADAGDLEQDTLATERELAGVAAKAPSSPTIRDADARYIALAARTSAGWSRQQVEACADLPLFQG